MNNDQLLPFQRLDAYKVAKELARKVHEGKVRDAELRDQATRAAKSAFLGLCEGLPSDAAGIRRRHFDIANNSLHELIGAVDLRSHRRRGDRHGARDSLSGNPPEAHAPRVASLTGLGPRAIRRARPEAAYRISRVIIATK
jgi:hypothetical protein